MAFPTPGLTDRSKRHRLASSQVGAKARQALALWHWQKHPSVLGKECEEGGSDGVGTTEKQKMSLFGPPLPP